jgi:hypothetical protein
VGDEEISHPVAEELRFLAIAEREAEVRLHLLPVVQEEPQRTLADLRRDGDARRSANARLHHARLVAGQKAGGSAARAGEIVLEPAELGRFGRTGDLEQIDLGEW